MKAAATAAAKSAAVGALVALGCFGTPASAEPINLSGRYACVQNCRDGLIGAPVYVTQNGGDINIVNEVGESARGWNDWFSPNRIWTEPWHQSAVYSPDGAVLQFDDGTVYQRDLGPYVVGRMRYR